MKKYLLVCISFVAAGLLQVSAQDNPWVELTDGRRISGVALTAAADGTLTLQVDTAGVRSTFRPAQVRRAYTPKPPEVARMEQQFQARRYSDVLQAASAAFQKHRFLGWGDYIAYLEGMCYVRQNRFDDALKSFQKGRAHVSGHGSTLVRGVTEALIGLQRYPEANQQINALIKSEDPISAAFAFNARGNILTAQNRKREAALEYMKSLFVVGKNAAPEQFQEAKASLLAILKEMNHPRLADFEKL